MTFEKLLRQSLVWRGFYFLTVLLVNVLLSRSLHAEGSGWVYYLTNFFSLLLLVAGLSMESGYTYYASGNIIQHNKLAWFSLLWTVLLAIITSVTMAFYFGRIKDSTHIERNTYIFYAATYVCGILLTNFFTVLFYAHKNFFSPNLLMGVMNLILCGCIFWFGKLHPSFGSLVNVYFSFFLLQGVALAIAFIWHNNSLSSISLPSKDELKLLLRYSLMALAGNLLFFFMYRIDYWFVRYYCHEAGAMGNYIQASKLAQMLLIVPQILASVVFPQTASGVPSNDIGKSILKLARVLMQVFFLLFLMLIFIGNSLFHFILGDTFNHVNMPLVLLLPGIFALSVLVLLSAFFSGKGRVRLNVIGTGIGVVVVIIGDVLLIPRFGINGAATASTIAYGIYLIYGLWHLKKMFTFRLKELFAFSLSDWRWVKQVLSNK